MGTCLRDGCSNPTPAPKRADRPRLFCSDRCRAYHRLEVQRKALADLAQAADQAADDLDRLRATLVGVQKRLRAMIGHRRKSGD